MKKRHLKEDQESLVDLDSNGLVEYAVPPEYWVGDPSDDVVQLFDARTIELIDRKETPLIRSVVYNLSVASDNLTTTDRMRMESPKQWDERTKNKQRPRYIASMFIRADEKELKKALEAISSGIYEYVKIIDPYLSFEWVDFISTFPDNVDVKIITSQPHKQNNIIQRFKKLHRINRIEIIKITDKNKKVTGTPLHDRYIITKDSGWQIGTSLNSASKNYTNIMQLPNKCDIEEMFDFLWDPNNIQDSHGGFCKKEKIYPE